MPFLMGCQLMKDSYSYSKRSHHSWQGNDRFLKPFSIMVVSLESYLIYSTTYPSASLSAFCLSQIIPSSFPAPLFTFICFCIISCFWTFRIIYFRWASRERLENMDFVFSMDIVVWEWRKEMHLKKAQWPVTIELSERWYPPDLRESSL